VYVIEVSVSFKRKFLILPKINLLLCDEFHLHKVQITIKKTKMRFILDNGHGGLINGKYQTKGKQSPKWENGMKLYEGDFNRSIVNGVAQLCTLHGIPFEILVPELTDVSLSTRVKRTNAIYSKDKSSVLVSIHANAGGGTGFEVFTTKGKTKSDALAEVMINQFGASIPELRLRKDTRDGDKDKEAQFYILRNTYCPAILVECAFMDTFEPDCRMMIEQPQRFVNAIFNGILSINRK
jgi:N-acetylmuramoyl-L-alanine amidase